MTERLAAALKAIVGGSNEVVITKYGARYRFEVPVSVMQEARDALKEHDKTVVSSEDN